MNLNENLSRRIHLSYSLLSSSVTLLTPRTVGRYAIVVEELTMLSIVCGLKELKVGVLRFCFSSKNEVNTILQTCYALDKASMGG
jgi:hypothetical protein